MKMVLSTKFFGGGKYTAPEIETYESVVERGFVLSEEEYYVNYGDDNHAGAGFIGEDGGDGYNDFGSF